MFSKTTDSLRMPWNPSWEQSDYANLHAFFSSFLFTHPYPNVPSNHPRYRKAPNFRIEISENVSINKMWNDFHESIFHFSDKIIRWANFPRKRQRQSEIWNWSQNTQAKKEYGRMMHSRASLAWQLHSIQFVEWIFLTLFGLRNCTFQSIRRHVECRGRERWFRRLRFPLKCTNSVNPSMTSSDNIDENQCLNLKSVYCEIILFLCNQSTSSLLYFIVYADSECIGRYIAVKSALWRWQFKRVLRALERKQSLDGLKFN